MIAVVSQAWLYPGELHASEYERLSDEFVDFHRRHAGYRGRRLLFGLDDPTHVINIRFFDSVADYEELIAFEGYGARIDELSQHLDLGRPPQKEYVEVHGALDLRGEPPLP